MSVLRISIRNTEYSMLCMCVRSLGALEQEQTDSGGSAYDSQSAFLFMSVLQGWCHNSRIIEGFLWAIQTV